MDSRPAGSEVQHAELNRSQPNRIRYHCLSLKFLLLSVTEREVEFGGEFLGVKRATRKEAVTDLESWNFASAVVDA